MTEKMEIMVKIELIKVEDMDCEGGEDILKHAVAEITAVENMQASDSVQAVDLAYDHARTGPSNHAVTTLIRFLSWPRGNQSCLTNL